MMSCTTLLLSNRLLKTSAAIPLIFPSTSNT
jgi:hypothetical protein